MATLSLLPMVRRCRPARTRCRICISLRRETLVRYFGKLEIQGMGSPVTEWACSKWYDGVVCQWACACLLVVQLPSLDRLTATIIARFFLHTRLLLPSTRVTYSTAYKGPLLAYYYRYSPSYPSTTTPHCDHGRSKRLKRTTRRSSLSIRRS